MNRTTHINHKKTYSDRCHDTKSLKQKNNINIDLHIDIF